MSSFKYDIDKFDVAVIIPCFNEEGAIGKVVRDFKNQLPNATVYVYNNNSTDSTASEALENGAIVENEERQGKGYVVRRMFADIDADLYVMVDGDDTYDALAVRPLIQKLVDDNLDMVSGSRETNIRAAYRTGHKFGNRLLTGLVRQFFGKRFSDMLSGYRVFTNRFVKSFPLDSGGFEIETELTVHALELEMPTSELSTEYKDRPEGTVSKLRTYADGLRILWMIIKLLKRERPMLLFLVVAFILIFIALVLAYPIFIEYLETGLVPRFPTAILSTGLVILGFLSFTCGIILDTVTKGRQEAKRMRYLDLTSTHMLIKNRIQ